MRVHRDIVGPVLGVLAACLMFFTLSASAAASELSKLLPGLGSSSRKEIANTVTAIGDLGDFAALPALEALREKRLRVDKQGKIYIADTEGEFVMDLDSGKRTPLEGLQLHTPRINNRVRRVLTGAIAQLQLFSPDPDSRLRAARALARKPSDKAAAQVRAALKKETVDEVRKALALVLAQLDLSASDPDRRLAAIVAIGGGAGLAHKAELEKFLARDEAGDFAEPDERVRLAATAAIAAIERVQVAVHLLTNLLYGLSLGSILLLAALGLAITFGLMGVINMAHGEMLMLGAYATFTVQQVFMAYWPQVFDLYLLAALPVAFTVCAAMGIVMERGVIRFLYGRPLETLLATWGISLLLIQTVRVIFGAQNVAVANPAWLSGGFEAYQGLVLPYNRIAIIVFATVTVVLVWLLLQRTSLGLHVRAVTQNRDMSAGLGISTRRVDMWTFSLGSGVAGLGGVALSQVGNVGPELGQSYIVDSFMVVVLGGVGKIAGTIVGAMGLGVAAKYLEPISDAVLAKIFLLVFIILFIQIRPQGIFALRGRAAEG